MAKLKKNDILAVAWIDAESIDAWTEFSDIDTELPPVITIGFLICQDDKTLTVGSNYDSKNDSYSCIMKIPKSMISKVKKII